ncbi:MAG: phytanoyl-CoA dioxygenase family protein [Coleofasciculus sp. S288]|nr:phytanoyl-CoA dioxygenase family protein [Coleofasciculus sp. S288]
MFLTEEQITTYKNNGFVLLDEYFSRTEIELMKAELPALFAEETSKRVLEEEGNTVRSVHGSHTTNEVFRRLSRHPRLVLPAMHILGSKVYVYQFKINAKAAFSGDVWEWHQDYIFWKKEDGLQTPRVTNALVFLDEMNELNGSLFFMVGSHKEGMIEVKARNFKEISGESKVNDSSWKSSFTAKLKYSLNQKMIADLALKYKIVSIKALPGSVLFFDSNIVHSSPNNISPFDRSVVIVTFNSIENIPSTVDNPRPDFLVSRDFRPIEPLSDNALLIQSVS